MIEAFVFTNSEVFVSAFDACVPRFHEGFEQPFRSCLSTDLLHGRQVVVQLTVGRYVIFRPVSTVRKVKLNLRI